MRTPPSPVGLVAARESHRQHHEASYTFFGKGRHPTSSIPVLTCHRINQRRTINDTDVFGVPGRHIGATLQSACGMKA